MYQLNSTCFQVAGSADNFRKVDLHYVEAAAEASKAAGAKHFSLVTAQGANPNTMANDMKPFHALLYMKVKGQVSIDWTKNSTSSTNSVCRLLAFVCSMIQ